MGGSGSGKWPGRQTPERDQAICEMRLNAHTLEEIGVRFGVTRERIRQICERAGVEQDGVGAVHERRKAESREWRKCCACDELIWVKKWRKQVKCPAHKGQHLEFIERWPKDRVIAALMQRAQGKSWREIGEMFGHTGNNKATICRPLTNAARHHGIDYRWVLAGKGTGNPKPPRIKPPAEWLNP